MCRTLQLQDGLDHSQSGDHRDLRDGIDLLILNHMVQFPARIDEGFAAISDPTRRGILDRLGGGDASISELASSFRMTLTGMKKHVHILESVGLVTTEKVGRVRICRLGKRRLDDETAWIRAYQQTVDARLERLGDFLERIKGEDV
jgi:DNA-binding transcriptional ArsR family regulator